MSDDNLIIDYQDDVATILLNRPAVFNAFDEKLIQELTQALHDIEKNETLRLLVLKAKGKYFSAGADLHWMQRMVNYSLQENIADAEKLSVLMHKLYHFKLPTLALVQGPAFGGGVGLIACCDIAIASSNTHFSFSEVKLGLVPAIISPYIIKAMGERIARRYFLTAEQFSAEAALSYGLIHEVVDADDLHKTGTKFITDLLNNSPKALQHTKQMINALNDTILHSENQKMLAELIAKIRVSKQGQHGLQAFLKKEKPIWIQ